MLSPIDIRYFKQIVGHQNIGKETSVDISARCPICGDSKKSKNKKRLHIYEKGGLTLINCFNCGAHHNVYNFIKNYGPDLLDSYKRETFNTTIDNLRKQDDLLDSIVLKTPNKIETQEDSWDSIVPEKQIAEVITHDLTSYFKPITESQEALDYLKGRGINYSEVQKTVGNFYTSSTDLKIGELTYKIKDSVIIPLYYNKVMYGFYSRKIHEKFFSTYNPDINIGYKIAFWFNIDKSKPVYIFESVFCALSAIQSGLTNSIALMSAKIPPERLAELKEPIFVLDNDKTGILNAIEYSSESKAKIFIYPDYINEAGIKDINELYLRSGGSSLKETIDSNLYQGLSAAVRLKSLI